MRRMLIFAAALILLLSACAAPAAQPSPEPVSSSSPAPESGIPGVTAENYPRIDGSTSTIGIVRTVFESTHSEYTADEYPVEAMRTVPSYRALIAGELDLIVVPYAGVDVLDEAEDAGVELEFTKVAAEGLIFITPKDNTAENITGDQVREIYLHNGIPNWTALGGPDKRLVPICRNPDSGSQSQLDNLILHGEPMDPELEQNHVELTMDGLVEQVAYYHHGGLDRQDNSDCYALGYTLYTYLKELHIITGVGDNLKILNYEGVAPTLESIASGEYPLADGYYAVVRADLPEDHPARAVVAWLASDAGQKALTARGFIAAAQE